MLAELVNPGTAAARWNDYLAVGNVKVGLRVTEVVAQTVSTRFFHLDHLGSVAVLTNENGAVVERLAYDAWGKRRHPNGADDPAGSIESETTRGFTGHEQLDAVALVHMNGRVYDPLVGRMISADPTVPDAMNGQAWNRYSYVGNDPLAFTDPSGFSWLSSFFRSVGNFIKSIIMPIVRMVLNVVLTAVLAFTGPAAPFLAAAISAAIVTGISGGKLGAMLKAAAIAGLTAYAFDAVGSATLGPAHAMAKTPEAYFANVAGHAAVGCVSSAASGGSCGSGAAAGAAGAAAAPLIGSVFPDPKKNAGDFIGGTAASAVAGGLASVAGGGKFENGAVTGAFGYMYNACGGPNGCLKAGTAAGIAYGMTSAGVITVGSGGFLAPVGIAIGGLDVLIGATLGAMADIIGDRWVDYVYKSDSTKNDGVQPPALDSTGKVHGEIPSQVPGNWTDDQLGELSQDLKTSLGTRQREQQLLGEDGPHRERMRQERDLLRQIGRKLGG